jgi:hypothetical protein
MAGGVLLSLAGLGVLGASFAVLWLLSPRQSKPIVTSEAAEVLLGFLLTVTIAAGVILLVAGLSGQSASTFLMPSATLGK